MIAGNRLGTSTRDGGWCRAVQGERNPGIANCNVDDCCRSELVSCIHTGTGPHTAHKTTALFLQQYALWQCLQLVVQAANIWHPDLSSGLTAAIVIRIDRLTDTWYLLTAAMHLLSHTGLVEHLAHRRHVVHAHHPGAVRPWHSVCCIPVLANGLIAYLQEFYEASVKHRKLTWIYSLGNCHLKGNFDAKPIELIITTSQAALLLLFNDGKLLAHLCHRTLPSLSITRDFEHPIFHCLLRSR